MAQTLPVRELALPHLEDNSPRSCPVTVEELARYLRSRTQAKEVSAADLSFVRTAQVHECAYWAWRFQNGQLGYVLVMRDPAGDAWISCYQSEANLDPEQVLLADYRVALEDG